MPNCRCENLSLCGFQTTVLDVMKNLQPGCERDGNDLSHIFSLQLIHLFFILILIVKLFTLVRACFVTSPPMHPSSKWNGARTNSH